MVMWQPWHFVVLCTLVHVSMLCQLACAGPSQRFLPDRVKEREGKEADGKILLSRKMGHNILSDFELEISTPNSPQHLGILAEPYKPTLFSMSLISEKNSIVDTWQITAEGPKSQKAFGSQVKMFFNETGLGQLKVFACPKILVSDSDCPAGTTMSFTIPVTVVYVRRELSTMSEEDIQKYFNAIKTMKNYTTEQGVKLFGSKYVSYDELAAHHAAAVWFPAGECDFGHHGPSLVTFHRAFGRLFEQVLQSVDPSLTSPYWDYLGEDPATSFFFSHEFYGNFTGDPSRDYQVFDGQFPNWKTPSGLEALQLSQMKWGKLGPSNMLNPYGYLRGKDNINKAPYLTRYGPASGMSVATTATWAVCANQTILGFFVHCLDIQTIHPVYHSYVGGTYGVPTFEGMKDRLDCSMFNSTEDCQTGFEEAMIYGGMYRAMGVIDGCVVCNKTCSVDKTESECGCQCANMDTTTCDPQNAILRMCQTYGIDMPTTRLELISDFLKIGICATTRAMGDYLDAAAAALDPIFWPIHANIDRLLTSWRQTKQSCPWTEMGFTYPSKDLAVFPDFRSATNILSPGRLYPGVSGDGDGNLSGSCYGQGIFDEIAAGSFVNTFKSILKDTPHTNLEVLETVDIELNEPEKADYVYDRYYDLYVE